MVDVEVDDEPAEEGTTWRKFVEVLLMLLLDMESRLDGLRNYRVDKRQNQKSEIAATHKTVINKHKDENLINVVTTAF